MFASLSLDVIDPCNRTGKIAIPMQHVVATKGVSDFQTNPAKRDGKELSLCLLFQKGRCNAGSKCHQVHADPSYVGALREKALSAKNCCSCHGDVHSTGFSATATVTIFSGTEEMLFPLASFARTSFLDAVLRNKSLYGPRAPAAKICRLHAQSRCKFGKDCKNIHLCPTAMPLPAAAPSARFIPAVALGCPSVDATPVKKLLPPAAVDAIPSCGVSVKSSEESTPREGVPKTCSPAPLDLELQMSSAQELSCVSSSWGVASPQFDMSSLEDTIRSLCMDLTFKEDPKAVCPPSSFASARGMLTQ